MTATRELYVRARPVIDRVLELTRARQSSLVSEACGADEELARFVRSLLKRQDQLAATDDDIDVLNVLSVSLDEDSTPGELGSYKILGRLGAGGMSVVYLAEQLNPRRLVALKVLRRAISAELLQHEVETLALLRHPGIAQVYEAGIAATPDGGKPFFVMEFVSSTGDTKATTNGARAQTLTEYVAERVSWDVPDRLEVLAKVCDAVNYAHKRGVIHRDLKPTNVLVDHLGQPKVIDFGIAMLAGPQHVESGGPIANMIAGTVPYMSPEQLRGDVSKIDLRSDVYALGVMAFQLLVGSLPYDGLTGEPEKDAQIVQRREPVRVSSRLTSISADVDAIIARATAKELEKRYQTAAALADDIRHFIGKRPVSARPNTIMYRTSCFLRRRPLLSASATVALVLIGGAMFQAYRENARAKDTLAILVRGIEQVDPISSDGSPPTLDRMLEAVTDEMDRRPSLQKAAVAQLHVLLGSLYFRNDPRGGVETSKAANHYRKAAQLLEEEFGAEDARAMRAKNNLGMAISKLGNPVEAERIFQELRPLRERADDRRGELVTKGNNAAALLRQGRRIEALREFDAVFDGFVALGDKYESLKTRGWQARLLMEAGYLEDAERIQRGALERSLAEGTEFNDLSLALMDGLTHNLIYQERWSDAAGELEKMRTLLTAAAPDHKSRRSFLLKMGKVQSELGNRKAALEAQSELAAWDAKYRDR